MPSRPSGRASIRGQEDDRRKCRKRWGYALPRTAPLQGMNFGWLSSAPVNLSSLLFSPLLNIRWMEVFLPFCEEYRIYLPQGENWGESLMPPSVSTRASEPSGFITHISSAPSVFDTKAIESPFGEKAGAVL